MKSVLYLEGKLKLNASLDCCNFDNVNFIPQKRGKSRKRAGRDAAKAYQNSINASERPPKSPLVTSSKWSFRWTINAARTHTKTGLHSIIFPSFIIAVVRGSFFSRRSLQVTGAVLSGGATIFCRTGLPAALIFKICNKNAFLNLCSFQNKQPKIFENFFKVVNILKIWQHCPRGRVVLLAATCYCYLSVSPSTAISFTRGADSLPNNWLHSPVWGCFWALVRRDNFRSSLFSFNF